MAATHTFTTDAPTYRGWDIEPGYFGWQGTHPDYDPTPLYADDGPSDHRYVIAESRSAVMNEIDLWFEEQAQ